MVEKFVTSAGVVPVLAPELFQLQMYLKLLPRMVSSPLSHVRPAGQLATTLAFGTIGFRFESWWGHSENRLGFNYEGFPSLFFYTQKGKKNILL
ncbi:hypothetical protein CDAR_433961 [Caerostris darwini]|uniref:Uncharacterized protein n=1 Tax=Caerostris darwini TaxID=1538125 RepID=A0AAV4QWL5_9ARAC|nr:hypothetical protein CDAR_433961 [Caerostris darwini]